MKKHLVFIFLYMQIVCIADSLQDKKIKILVGSPIHQKPNILKEFLASLKRLEKDYFILDYFFIDDNNVGKSSNLLKYFKKGTDSKCLIQVSKDDLQFQSDDTKNYWNEKLVDKVAIFKDHMIHMAINDKYDYLFLIDSDIVLHPKTIKQLIHAKKDIVSNIFWTKNLDGTSFFPQIWVSDENTLYKHDIGEKLTNDKIKKRTFDFFNMLEKPGLYEVGGLRGCTLISKKALEKGLSFQRLSNLPFLREDKHFCIRAAVLGLSLFVDTHNPAYHVSREFELEDIEEFKKKCNLSNKAVSYLNYLPYIEENVDMSYLWYFRECQAEGVYLHPCFQKHIDKKNVSSVLEIGSRDLKDAIKLSDYFKCHVFAFECNPACLKVCRINDKHSRNVNLIEKAAWNISKNISFYPVIYQKRKYSNPGLSSCFKMTEKNLIKYAQDTIEVSAIRIDDWMKENHFESIDLICMNAKGANLKILEGMGEFLKKTKYIITECQTSYEYETECLLPELISFLKNKEFELIPTEIKNNLK